MSTDLSCYFIIRDDNDDDHKEDEGKKEKKAVAAAVAALISCGVSLRLTHYVQSWFKISILASIYKNLACV